MNGSNISDEMKA